MRREYQILDRAFDHTGDDERRIKIPHRTAAMAIGVERSRRQDARGAVSVITGLELAPAVVLLEDIEAGATAYPLLHRPRSSWRSTTDGAETVLFTLDNMTLELMAPSGHSPTRRAASAA